jgi:hypothetical protein
MRQAPLVRYPRAPDGAMVVPRARSAWPLSAGCGTRRSDDRSARAAACSARRRLPTRCAFPEPAMALVRRGRGHRQWHGRRRWRGRRQGAGVGSEADTGGGADTGSGAENCTVPVPRTAMCAICLVRRGRSHMRAPARLIGVQLCPPGKANRTSAGQTRSACSICRARAARVARAARAARRARLSCRSGSGVSVETRGAGSAGEPARSLPPPSTHLARLSPRKRRLSQLRHRAVQSCLLYCTQD